MNQIPPGRGECRGAREPREGVHETSEAVPAVSGTVGDAIAAQSGGLVVPETIGNPCRTVVGASDEVTAGTDKELGEPAEENAQHGDAPERRAAFRSRHGVGSF